MELVQLACPLCDGVFQVDLAWQGTQVACPHCAQAVTVPWLDAESPPEIPQIDVGDEAKAESLPVLTDAPQQAAAPAPSKPAAPKVSKVEALKLARRLPARAKGDSPFAVRDVAPKMIGAEGRTIELRRRTPDEQARFRKRLHLCVAVVGAIFLALLMLVLLQLGP